MDAEKAIKGKIFKITEEQFHYLNNMFESNEQNDAFGDGFKVVRL